MSRALFGEELEKAVENLHRQFYILQTYVDAYIEDHDGNDKKFTMQIRRALYASATVQDDSENEISDAVGKAICTIEKICLPRLRLEMG